METSVAATPRVAASPTRVAGWLLAISPLVCVVPIASGFLGFTFSDAVPDLGAYTPAIMATVRPAWIVFHLGLFAMVLCGAGPIAVLANGVQTSLGRGWSWAALGGAAVALAIMAIAVALRLSVLQFTEPTLGQVPAYTLSLRVLRLIAFPLALATLSIGVALWRAAVAPRTGPVVALLAALLLPVSVFAWFPLFAFAPLWAALRIAVLRQRAL